MEHGKGYVSSMAPWNLIDEYRCLEGIYRPCLQGLHYLWMWSYFLTHVILRRYILSRLYAKIQLEGTLQPRNRHIWNSISSPSFSSDENSVNVKMIMKHQWSDTDWGRAKQKTRPTATSFTTNHMWVPVKRTRTSEVRGRRLSAWYIRIHGVVTTKTNLDTYRTENINS
jgi:hypothetical protein